MPALGVGIVGSGSVVRGIHLPTLARIPELFEVRHITDVDSRAARSVAESAAARWSTSIDDLLSDDDVDVVAVCSPHRFHAEHVIAACEAGKAAVLCEKPFATSADEAERIAESSRRTGVPVVVGAMHTYDPAWTWARAEWENLPDDVRLVRSSIVLPTNDRFEGWSTEVPHPTEIPSRDVGSPEARAAAISARLLGLAIHDLPLVRTFLPHWRDLEVISAQLLHPVGYAVLLRAGDRLAQIVGSFRSHWAPEWEFEAVGSDAALAITFPPSYVHAGSATACLRRAGERRVSGDDEANGYEREWSRVHDLATGSIFDPAELDVLVDDLCFAVMVADRAGAYVKAAA